MERKAPTCPCLTGSRGLLQTPQTLGVVGADRVAVVSRASDAQDDEFAEKLTLVAQPDAAAALSLGPPFSNINPLLCSQGNGVTPALIDMHQILVVVR